MDKERYGYIYLTTSLVNNKRYIGQHISPTFDSKYKGSGRLLVKALVKYGRNNFNVELLEWCSDIDEMNTCEEKWISVHNAVELKEFYNLAVGGQNTRHTEEVLNKIRRKREAIEENGLSVMHNANIRAAETKKITILDNGNSLAKEASIRAAGTMSIIHNGISIKDKRLQTRIETMDEVLENGKTGFQIATEKCIETKNKIGEDGLNTHQRAARKRHETMSIIGEDGLTGHQRSALKSKETQLKNGRKRNG